MTVWDTILTQPSFWAWHFANTLQFTAPDGSHNTQLEESVFRAAFGTLPRELTPTPWLELAGQPLELEIGPFLWRIAWQFGEDPATSHHLTRGGWERGVLLGYNDAHFHLPILRLQELDTILKQVRGSVRPELIPLLLWPTVGVGRSCDLAAASACLHSWLSDSGLFSVEGVETLAPCMLSKWPLSWYEDEDLEQWVNNGAHSHRNPERTYWKQEDFDAFGELQAHLAAGTQ